MTNLKVYPLINRRRFQQMDVLESINILVTISGKKNKIRVYYLSWLKNKIVKTDTVCIYKKKIRVFKLLKYSKYLIVWEKARIRECWWTRRLRTFQDRSIRQDQIPSGWPQRLDRSVRMGSKTLLQIHGIQIVPESSTQAFARRLGHRGGNTHESLVRFGNWLSCHRSRLRKCMRHLYTAYESGWHVYNTAYDRCIAEFAWNASFTVL